MGEVTELLKRVRANDRAALDELISVMYPDLHRMAGSRLAQNQTMTLLDATFDDARALFLEGRSRRCRHRGGGCDGRDIRATGRASRHPGRERVTVRLWL